MNITVFGATGTIGSLTVDELLARGHDVTAHARNAAKAPAGWGSRVRVVVGEMADAQQIEAAVAGADAVVSAGRRACRSGCWALPSCWRIRGSADARPAPRDPVPHTTASDPGHSKRDGIKCQWRWSTMVTKNVVLTQHQHELVQALVASGRYQNASEVLRDGLRLLEREDRERTVKLSALREASQHGWSDLASGRFDDIADEDLDDFIGQLGVRAVRSQSSS